MFKRHIITLIAIAGVTASALALAHTDHPQGTSLEDNDEYKELMVQSERLTIKEDSIRTLLSDTRATMRSFRDSVGVTPPMDMDAYTTRIVQLEEELFNITSEQGLIANRINAIEMAAMEEQFAISIMEKIDIVTGYQEEWEDDYGGIESDNLVEERRHRNIIDNGCFTNSLIAADLEELRTVQQEEAEVERLSAEYIAQYELIRDLDSKYEIASSQSEADSLYGYFEPMAHVLDSLNTLISRKWNHVIDTKYYAYGYIAEKRRNTELLNKLDNEFTSMLQMCATNDDMYSSNGLMRYAIGRPAILDFEIGMATVLNLSEAQDSLQSVRNTLVVPEYQQPVVEVPERRIFIDYNDITFGRTNYYNTTNPVPDIEIYERGMVYRILLGSFKSRQPMTLFKGVQPLYIQKDDDGLNHYYAGGFATLEEAEEAQQQLRKKGFKSPEICCWLDGVMTNLTKDSVVTDEDAEATPATIRYMLRIAEGDMSDALQQYIGEQYPDKMISLTNDGYIVGAFDNHDEATRLYISLGDEYGIDLEIIEIELH